jgi:hypothetical protein
VGLDDSQTIGKLKTSAGTFDFGTLRVIYLSVTKASLQDSTGSNFLDDTLLLTIVHELEHAFFDLPDRYYAGTTGTGQTGSFERPLLLTHIATTESVSLCARMKS